MRIAEEMAKEQKEISISEFFEKNRHLLGFDNKVKALLTIVKEAVDNSLDACEEAKILPKIFVKVEELEKEKFKIIIKDNGPGIVKKQIPNIFGKLLYGSKFHKLRQSRGQQGLGISAAALYSQLTTGEPIEIFSSLGNGETYKYLIKIDVKKNEPVILSTDAFNGENWHGVQVKFIAEGIYREQKQSILEYLRRVAIANPYAEIIFDSPNGRIEFKRGIEELPPLPKEIKPHLHGVELGIFSRMLRTTKARTLLSFLTTEFTRIGKTTAIQIIKKAGITCINKQTGKEEPDIRRSPRKITEEEVKKLISAVKEVKLLSPPTDCLSPLGKELIENGLKKELNPEFVAAISRQPAVYRGFPFQVEVGIAYGGSIQEPELMRFANRVPLLYQQGDCAITKAVSKVDWKRYGLQGDKFPEGPVVIFVHLCSVWVPFTSESKEAIANYPIIIKEIKLALQDCARKLGLHLSGKRRAERLQQKIETFKKYASEIAVALEELTGKDKNLIEEKLTKLINSKINLIKMQEQEMEESEAEEKIKENGEENGNEEKIN